jgi:predicted amidohydrolase YtcJ
MLQIFTAMNFRLIALGMLLVCASCLSKVEVDTVVFNGQIYALDSVNTTYTAMVIDKGRIVTLGTDDLKNRFLAKKFIDLEGKAVVPGLIDAHSHFYGLGLGTLHVDLVGTESIEEILNRIDTFRSQNKDVAFIYGRGWDQNDWETKEFPTRYDLDRRFYDLPVVLERIDGHAYWVNSEAIKLAKIDTDTPSKGGAIITLDDEPSGILVDGPMRFIDAVMPPPSRDQQIKGLLAAQEICFDYGLTTVSDAGISKDVIHLIDSLQKEDLLKIRLYAMVSNTEADVNYFLSKGPYKTERLNVSSVKVYGDGALGSRGAALKRPYADAPGHFGAFVTPVNEMRAIAERLIDSDFQMNTHAIGDAANFEVLSIYQDLLSGEQDRRWRIEHAQIVDELDFSLFAKGVIPSVQPTHATSDMYWAEDRLGHERMVGAYAYQTLLAKSGIVALGTDFPVESVNPYYTFYAAVARKDLKGYPDAGFIPEQSLTREQALRGMTEWAAYAQFEENEKGRLLPGFFADFTVLSADLMTASEKDLPMIKAEMVFIGGEQVK